MNKYTNNQITYIKIISFAGLS